MTLASRQFLIVFVAVPLVANGGCDGIVKSTKAPKRSTWHDKFDWRAEKYFKDPQVIALCHAIEANDLAEIDRLVTAGADVNAKGKENMTPLLWAFPDNKPDRFKRLLEHGADPNVIVTSDFNTKGQGIAPGDSITHLAAKSWFPDHFKYVMEHGGDANLIHPRFHETPIFTVIQEAPQKTQRIQLLIEKGADLNYVSGTGATPVIQAVSWGGQYGLALMLLNAGADPKIYQSDQLVRLVHIVVFEESRLKIMSPEQKEDYGRLIDWLEQHGESIEEARSDALRWKSWSKIGSIKKMKQLSDAEIAERLAREKAGRDEALTREAGEPKAE